MILVVTMTKISDRRKMKGNSLIHAVRICVLTLYSMAA